MLERIADLPRVATAQAQRFLFAAFSFFFSFFSLMESFSLLSLPLLTCPLAMGATIVGGARRRQYSVRAV